MTAPRRSLSLLDCVGIGINGIIGSGIFLLPTRVFAAAGAFSWAAWFVIGGVCLLVGLCFGEAAGRTDHNGGPYVYARDAFGATAGVAVGWMALASVLLGYGAVARALGRNLSYLIPALSSEGGQVALALAIIAFLTALNWRGVKPGAIASDLFSGAKLVPIVLFIGAGLFFVDWSRIGTTTPAGSTHWGALKLGGIAALFACTGFEYVPVPAGETDKPRRNVPLALIGSLFGATLLYALVQIVFVGTHPNPAAADKPLAEAATAFAGAWAGRFVTIGAVVSSFGFCAGVALVAPRYLAVLGEDAAFPRVLARRHPRFGTPTVAIAATAVLTAGLAVFADFDRLSDLSNAAVFAQYVPTCLAVLVFRRRRETRGGFVLPFGPLIPILATAGCLLFLNGIKNADVIFSVVVLAAGLSLHAAYLLLRPRAGPAAG